jgi:hypothetical protein
MNTPTRETFEKWAANVLSDNPTWRESGACELAWQAWQAGHAAALAELLAGGVELPEPLYTNSYRCYGDAYSSVQILNYGDRRAAAAIPAGYVLVPEVPTDAMLEANAERWQFWRSLYDINHVHDQNIARAIERAVTPEQLDAAVDAARKEKQDADK